MDRDIANDLTCWKNDSNRCTLLVRGARQVGKTYSIRQLGKSFRYFIEVNFEARPEAKQIFGGSLLPEGICERLSALYDTPIRPSETLLFFDEVQACPDCLRALRFFHENMPQLHVAAAGSLLEFAVAEIPSFGVGRISSLYMYPLTFSEFVRTVAGEGMAAILKGIDLLRPVEEPFHTRFLELYRTYLIVGGMPAVVDAYASSHDLRAAQRRLSVLLDTFQDDFAKYAGRVPAQRLRDTLHSAARQAGGKFVYASVAPEVSSAEARNALVLLEMAGLLTRVHHTSARGIPLGAQTNPRQFKALLLDVGLHLRLLGLGLSELLLSDVGSLTNKGSLAELFVGLELLHSGPAYMRPELHYWHREARSSSAEVDYVIQRGRHTLPIEVKSGGRGGMKSLHLFLAERDLPLGVRLSAENVGRYGAIVSLPVYAAAALAREAFDAGALAAA